MTSHIHFLGAYCSEKSKSQEIDADDPDYVVVYYTRSREAVTCPACLSFVRDLPDYDEGSHA